jgi:hypothetical protein
MKTVYCYLFFSLLTVGGYLTALNSFFLMLVRDRQYKEICIAGKYSPGTMIPIPPLSRSPEPLQVPVTSTSFHHRLTPCQSRLGCVF